MNVFFDRLSGWLDERTGYRAVLHEALYENIPGGSRWRYVTGSMLVFAFFTQTVTGLFLWMSYSPSGQTAWESVHYIQHTMIGGSWLRGVHHFMASAMVVLLVLHFLQVVVDRAYTKPREINFWLGLVLMLITLGLALTGYLLPWDQKGYWATNVATNLMIQAPGGEVAQKVVVGGGNYGHLTLTRFFAVHAGLLPALLVLVLAVHVALFRRHGITAIPSRGRPDETFWPVQVLKDGVACLGVLLIVLGFVWWRGAELGPPADPSVLYEAARPEWYFLFLFELLKYFGGEQEKIGAIYIPGLVLLIMFLMPIFGRWRWGHRFNVLFLVVLLAGAGVLTGLAWRADRNSGEFLLAKQRTHLEAERMNEVVARYGIPKSGALTLAREDPYIQGPRLFKTYCAACHSYGYPKMGGHYIPGPEPPKPDPDGTIAPCGAPNLYRFASRQWLTGLLDAEKIAGHDYFGLTAHGEKEEGMVSFVQSDLADLDEAAGDRLQNIIKALSAEAKLSYQEDDHDGEAIAAGREALTESFDTYSCLDCHSFQGDGGGDAPDLTGYGSYDWLYGMISDPNQKQFYGYVEDANDRMPAFHKDLQDPNKNTLTAVEVDLLVRWLREEYDLKRPER